MFKISILSPIFWLLLVVPCSFAFTVDEPLSEPALELRAQSLFREIRCVVCQGETIADSNAAVAGDMRRSIREKIATGVSDDKIKEDFSTRYGDMILMKPPLKNSTILLWLGPWLVLFIGGIAVYFYFRKPRQA